MRLVAGLLCAVVCVGVMAGQGPTAPAGVSGAAPAAQRTGQKAVSVVLQEYVLNPLAVTKAGKPLASTGSWTAGNRPTAVCKQTGGTCVQVSYHVPAEDVTCTWVLLMAADGSGGRVVEQNDDATRYLMRRLDGTEARAQVVTRKKVVYPAMARAAHMEGTVVLGVVVSASGGTPEKVFPLSGPEMLRTAAAEAVQGWMFRPLMAGARPIAYQTSVTFRFRYAATGGTVTTEP